MAKNWMLVTEDELVLAFSAAQSLWQPFSALETVQTRWQVQSTENQDDSKLKVAGFSITWRRWGTSASTSFIFVKKAGR